MKKKYIIQDIETEYFLQSYSVAPYHVSFTEDINLAWKVDSLKDAEDTLNTDIKIFRNGIYEIRTIYIKDK